MKATVDEICSLLKLPAVKKVLLLRPLEGFVTWRQTYVDLRYLLKHLMLPFFLEEKKEEPETCRGKRNATKPTNYSWYGLRCRKM